ncbi:MAG: hypothetical protein GY711_21020 [bacterium]|nr:hypothetical protein [bacterium]
MTPLVSQHGRAFYSQGSLPRALGRAHSSWSGASTARAAARAASNLDGRAEIAIGAPQNNTNPVQSGYVEVRSGIDGCMIGLCQGPTIGDGYGLAVASAGDFDADGFDDLIVGVPFRDTALHTGAGSAWVYKHKFFGSPVGATYCHCTGNGSCGNGHGSQGGCHNSVTTGGAAPGGALLEAYGSTSLGADDLRFSDNDGRVAYGPCVVGTLNNIMVGSQVAFQLYYRDSSGPCGQGANLTNAISITFTP